MTSSTYQADNHVEWFLLRVVTPQPNDVLVMMVSSDHHHHRHNHATKPSFRIPVSCAHPGNHYFQELVQRTSSTALTTTHARELVYAIYHRSPPGRFLVQNPVDMSWHNIGVEDAVQATQQAWWDLQQQQQQQQQQRMMLPSPITPIHNNMQAMPSSYSMMIGSMDQEQLVSQRLLAPNGTRMDDAAFHSFPQMLQGKRSIQQSTPTTVCHPSFKKQKRNHFSAHSTTTNDGATMLSEDHHPFGLSTHHSLSAPLSF